MTSTQHLNQMKIFSAIAAAAVIGASLVSPNAALAGLGADSCTLAKDPNQTPRQRRNAETMCQCMQIYKASNTNLSDRQIIIDCIDVVKMSQ